MELFQTSDSVNQLLNAVAECKKMLGNTIAFDDNNPHFKNDFASLKATLKKIEGPTRDCNLIFTQWPAGEMVVNRLQHLESGEWMQSAFNLTMVKKDPQAAGSALSYARRQCYQTIFGLVGDKDDDGEMAMGRGGSDENDSTPPSNSPSTPPANNRKNGRAQPTKSNQFAQPPQNMNPEGFYSEQIDKLRTRLAQASTESELNLAVEAVKSARNQGLQISADDFSSLQRTKSMKLEELGINSAA